ncbi:MAG TPA: glucose dehydrogenase [Methylomirabilota bacterium]|nr:glucose dehydrogenase [Methylomirabilota bacterium]
MALPTGYRIEAMAEGLTFPTGVAFDSQGAVYVVESGYSYGEKWTTPRLLRIGANGQLVEVASGGRNGPWTGAAFFEGAFYIAEGGAMEGGRILRVTPGGQTQAIVDGLPSFGDHHTDGPVVGPDGWIYFGQGTASNSGVVGPDNLKFGWLKRAPSFHDIPGEDVTLVGQNFASVQRGKITGAFVPDGEATSHGQVVKGQVKCSGGILRVRPDGSNLELVAWGFRNPFGLAFSPEGALYATDNGYDERGSRPVWGSPDFLWKVERGLWHGWPDFVGGLPITEEQFKPPTKPNPKFLLAKHPNKPPQPAARLPVHSSANGLDFSRSPDFGHVGQAFVALFGDQTPVVGKSLHPAGFKVVRVDPQTGVIEDFAVNKGRKNGPASKVGGGGLERPVAARFSPDGKALYIVDFGMMPHDKAGAKPKEGTGVIWKVTREGGEK